MKSAWDNNVILHKADKLAHWVYKVTKKFPKDELYGITSQLRRAALSVVLNNIEGYARFKRGSHINFLEISFGSLKEVKYLIDFSYIEGYMSKLARDKLFDLSEEISKMLYAKIKTMKNMS